MNELKGCQKILAGMGIFIVIFLALIPLSDGKEIISVVVALFALLAISLIIWGLTELGKAIDLGVIQGKQENTGILVSADDVRKAYNADWISFQARKIFPVTDDANHPYATLVEIAIYHIVVKGETTNVQNNIRTIMTGDKLQKEKNYIVNENGNIKEIEQKV